MQGKAKRFRSVRFGFKTETGTDWKPYMITNNYIASFRVNQWLRLKSLKSRGKASTGQEYAKKMAVFLNWLDRRNVSFGIATNRHARQFLHFLIRKNELAMAEAEVALMPPETYTF